MSGHAKMYWLERHNQGPIVLIYNVEKIQEDLARIKIPQTIVFEISHCHSWKTFHLGR